MKITIPLSKNPILWQKSHKFRALLDLTSLVFFKIVIRFREPQFIRDNPRRNKRSVVMMGVVRSGCDGSRISSRLEVVRGRIVRVSELTDRRGGGIICVAGRRLSKHWADVLICCQVMRWRVVSRLVPCRDIPRPPPSLHHPASSHPPPYSTHPPSADTPVGDDPS